MSAVVLTSENSEAFYADRLGLPAPEPAAAPAKPAGEPAVESGKEASTANPEPETVQQQNQNPDPEGKNKHDVRVRFSELSKQRDEAKALAEKHAADLKAEREARELAERRAQELEAKVNPPPKAEEGPGPKPKADQFKDAFEYAEALAEWSAENAIHERDVRDAEAKQRAEAEARVSAFQERQEKAKAEIPDYEEAIKASAVVVSAEVREAILESDVGPQVLHYLAKNPEVADKLAKMSVGRAMREFGKLETSLAEGKKPAAVSAAASPSGAAKPAAAVSEISRAPAPITPLRASANAEPASLIDEKGVFHGTAAQWRAAREKGLIK